MIPQAQTLKLQEKAGWAGAKATPITPDWSPRQFWRLQKADGQTAVLMHAPSNIPGHDLTSFIKIAALLRDAGLSAPQIFAAEADNAIIEDFGNTPIDTPAVEREAYEAAVDVLAVMRGLNAPLTKYEDGYIYKKLALFSDDPAWMTTWQSIMQSLPPCPYVFSHMDYKAGNLHWLPERAGVKRIGLLDFQAAQNAPFTYDIVNLLEDARRDLEPALKAQLKARFKHALPTNLQAIFDDWYIVMAAQFHARVLGQIRGNARVSPDVRIRLEAYLKTELQASALAPIKSYLR